MKCLLIFLFLPLLAGLATGPEMRAEEDSESAELPIVDTLWDWQHPDRSETAFRDLLKKAEKALDPGYTVEVMSQIARAQGLQGKFDEALKMLDEAEKKLSETMILPRVRCLLERGRVHNSAGRSEKAREYFIPAWELALAHHLDLYAVDAAHMMGIAETDSARQLEWSLKALDLVEKSQDRRIKGWLGPMYNNIGWTYHDMKEYDKALELFEKSLAFRQKIKDENGIRIAKYTIGRCYRSLGRIDDALALQREVETELRDKALDPDGYVLEELGELLLLKGDAAAARPYFRQSWEILSRDPWMVEHEKDRLDRMKKLGAADPADK